MIRHTVRVVLMDSAVSRLVVPCGVGASLSRVSLLVLMGLWELMSVLLVLKRQRKTYVIRCGRLHVSSGALL